MDKIAALSNDGEITMFSYANKVIRFRTSRHLIRYTKVLEWDNGYIVVMARYDTSEVDEEEYIDLCPMLKNLYIEPQEFLNKIEGVRLDYA